MSALITTIPRPGRSSRIWPISIIGFFGLFFAGLVAFIVFAGQHQVDLVRPDYYEEEIRYQTQLDKINRARRMPHPAEIRFDSALRRITLSVPPGHARGCSGQVHLYRPSDAQLDLKFPLAVNDKGEQHVDTSTLSPGLWKVRITWTASGHEYFFEQPVVLPRS